MKIISFLNRCMVCLALLSMAGLVQTLKAAFPPDPTTWPPIVHVVASDPYAAEEGADPATFEVFRIGGTDTALTVFFEVGGSASYGVDYNLLAPDGGALDVVTNSRGLLFSVGFAPGQFVAGINAVPIDDYEVEGWEHLVLALEQPAVWPPPYIVDWPSVAPAWIEDNDPGPTNQPPRVALINPPDGAVFAGVESIWLVARASDADDRVFTVEFFDGTNSLGIVTNRLWPTPTSGDPAAITDPAVALDTDLLPDPTTDLRAQISRVPLDLFRLVWEDPNPGRHVLTAVATDAGGASTTSDSVIIFVLEHAQPVVSVRATDPEATEPSLTVTHLDTATFTIHRTGPTNFPLTVWYKLGGRASNGVDYAEVPTMTTIPEGARTVDVVIQPLADGLVEGDEMVHLSIVPPVCLAIFPPPADCYVVGDANTARAVIHDADAANRPPTVRIVRPLDGSVFLAPADITIVAQPYDPDGYWVAVEFFAGTNSLGIVSNSALTVLPMVVWSNVPPGRYVLTAVATDDDGARGRSRPVDILVVHRPMPPEVNIVATDPIATEPSMPPVDTATFTVTRTGSTSNALTVFYGIGGTASNGVDYQTLPGRVVIPQGAVAADIVVAPFGDDLLVEGLETVVLSLQYPPYDSAARVGDYYIIGPYERARAVIRDNNVAPSNLPPRVAIVSPEDGDVFHAFADIPIYAAACDPDGAVRTVEFFAGTNSLGVVSNSAAGPGPGPGGGGIISNASQLFRLVWSNVPPGGYALTALATDNDGARAKSEPVHIRVALQLPPVVTIHATDPQASEGPSRMTNSTIPGSGGPGDPRMSNLVDIARFTVRRSGGTNTDLTVFYTVRGTASNGVDYAFLPGRVTIPRGSYSANIIVVPVDDRLVEGTEMVVATLQAVACPAIYPPPASCYVVGDPNAAAAYILDNDYNQSTKVEIVQPMDGQFFLAPANIRINVVACDPDGWVERIEFYAGTNLIGAQDILFIVPPPPGQVQTFSMVWSNVPAGGYVLTARVFDNEGMAKISDPVRVIVLDTIPIPIVSIVARDRIATEPDPLSPLPVLDTATFTVERLGGDVTQQLRVFYRVSGTASNGVDYHLLSGHVDIPPSAAAADIVVAPLDDNLAEGFESVIVSLEQLRCMTTNLPPPAGCYIVGQPGRAIAYIRDNDMPSNQPPSVALIAPANGAFFTAPADIRLVASARDADGWVSTVEFFANGVSLGIVSNELWIVEPVRLPELGGTVLAGPSVTPRLPITPPFVLSWPDVPPGQYTLLAVATDNLGAPARSAPVQITVLESNDVPVVNIMAVDAIAREGTTNRAVFRVRRHGNTNDSITVHYSIGGTASNGVDYVTIANHVTIPAGRRSARIVITPIDDTAPERIETVVLRLQPSPLDVYPPPYQVGRRHCAAAIIVDNDLPDPPTMTLPDGNFHLRVPLARGLPYRVEASSDLRNWEAVADDVVTEGGISYVEGESSELGLRFYRVIPELEPSADD